MPRDTHDLDEEMERVFAGVSSEADHNRFDLSKFASDRSPRPGDRRFSEDDYTGKSHYVYIPTRKMVLKLWVLST